MLTELAAQAAQPLATAVLAALLAAVVWIDARHMVIPDRLNAVILATGVAALLLAGTPTPASGAAASILGAAAMAGVRELVTRRAGREAMGLGDVKFVAAVGVWLGLAALPTMLLVASVTGLVFALLSRRSPDARIPFGPFLAVGALAARLAETTGLLG